MSPENVNKTSNKPVKYTKCCKCKRTGYFRYQCRYAIMLKDKQIKAFGAIFSTGEFTDKDCYVASPQARELA